MEHVERKGEVKNEHRILDHLRDAGMFGRIILKQILKKRDVNLGTRLQIGTNPFYCEHDNRLSGFMKEG